MTDTHPMTARVGADVCVRFRGMSELGVDGRFVQSRMLSRKAFEISGFNKRALAREVGRNDRSRAFSFHNPLSESFPKAIMICIAR
jgi:hypothetical protein